MAGSIQCYRHIYRLLYFQSHSASFEKVTEMLKLIMTAVLEDEESS